MYCSNTYQVPNNWSDLPKAYDIQNVQDIKPNTLGRVPRSTDSMCHPLGLNLFQGLILDQEQKPMALYFTCATNFTTATNNFNALKTGVIDLKFNNFNVWCSNDNPNQTVLSDAIYGPSTLNGITYSAALLRDPNL